MNKSQIDYCTGRIKAILNEKLESLKERYLIRPEKRLSLREKVNLVIQYCSLPVQDSDRAYVEDLFDFSAFEHTAEYRKGYEDERKALLEEARRLTDAIFLSDSGEALAMLRNFEKMEKEEKTSHEFGNTLPEGKGARKRPQAHLRH